MNLPNDANALNNPKGQPHLPDPWRPSATGVGASLPSRGTARPYGNAEAVSGHSELKTSKERSKKN